MKIPLVWLALVCAPIIFADPAFAQASAQKRVIVFNALRKDAPVPLSIDRDFQRIIGDGLAGGLDYYSESIDVARFSDDDYQVALREFLARKYQGRRFDLVIAVSETCLTFVEKNREALFPDTPIVFLVSPGTRRSANSTGRVHQPRLESARLRLRRSSSPTPPTSSSSAAHLITTGSTKTLRAHSQRRSGTSSPSLTCRGCRWPTSNSD